MKKKLTAGLLALVAGASVAATPPANADTVVEHGWLFELDPVTTGILASDPSRDISEFVIDIADNLPDDKLVDAAFKVEFATWSAAYFREGSPNGCMSLFIRDDLGSAMSTGHDEGCPSFPSVKRHSVEFVDIDPIEEPVKEELAGDQ